MEICNELLEQSKIFGLNEEECKNFIEKLKRTPSKEELSVCGALWSEHCSYKSSRVHLKRFHTQEPGVLQGPGENAGVVSITEEFGIAFKMESHNHPSYIEPYQGAATGVGGILRDVFCMGAMPIANLNCLRFGEGTWNGKLLKNTVRGIGDYGNSMGIPTVGGDTSFHHGYSKNILVNAFSAGLIHKDKIFKGILSASNSNEVAAATNKTELEHILPNSLVEANSSLEKQLFPEGENIIIYFGSATGRDGVHGATMSSSEFSSTSQTLKPTVQVGDPFAEKILLEATLALIEKKLTVGLQDMGAAGLTSSSVEMAGRSDCGVVINLNDVPQRASNMQAWEILLSESQERMLCAVEPQNVSAVLELLKGFQLSAAVIGKVNRTGKFVCLFDRKMVTAIPIPILLDETPKYQWPLQNREEYLSQHKEILNMNSLTSENNNSLNLCGKNEEVHKEILNGISLRNLLEKFPNLFPQLFSHPSFASRESIYHHYCSTVQGNTVTGCGAIQSSAAPVVRLPEEAQQKTNGHSISKIGCAVAAGCEERWVELDPLAGSSLSVLKVARKIVASNGVPLAMTDCLNFGSPKSPEVMRQFSDTVDGLNCVAKELKIPVVSGNVSLNNQTEGKAIPPTPMIGMVGRVNDVSRVPKNIVPKNTLENDTQIYLFHFYPSNYIENSSYLASQSAWTLGGKNSQCPKLDLESEKMLWQGVQNIIQSFEPLLCLPIGHGGLLGTILTCALNSRVELKLSEDFWNAQVKNILAEGNMGFIFGFLKEPSYEEIIRISNTTSCSGNYIGTFLNGIESSNYLNFPLSKIKEGYFKSLQKFYMGS